MSKSNRTRMPEGIEVRHQKACKTRTGGRCNCRPSYRAKVSGPNGRLTSAWSPSLDAARNWKIDTLASIKNGQWVEPTTQTVRDAAQAFIAGAKDGSVLTRKGTTYAPSARRGYERALNKHVLPVIGDQRLSDVRRADVQKMVDDLRASGLAGSSVRNALDPLRRIFDRAVKRDLVMVSPCDRIEVPHGTGVRERIASPEEAELLIAALPSGEQGIWATAFYAGLRMSELRALRWTDIDLENNIIRVRRSWDDVEAELERGKSEAAARDVMVIDELRPFLLAHKMATGRRDGDLVFGRTADDACVRSTVRSRALRAWKKAKLTPISPHEARHTFGSLIAAAGINVSERQRQMGHASSAMMDRYTHGIDGSIAEAAELLQAYLDRRKRKAS